MNGHISALTPVSSSNCHSALPESPVPELLRSNEVPTTEQEESARSAIRQAHAILELLETADPKAKFALQRDRLQDFIDSHKRVISAVRRIPKEMLLNIASYLNPRSTETGPDELWALVSTCAGWRNVLQGITRYIHPLQITLDTSIMDGRAGMRRTLGQVRATGVAGFVLSLTLLSAKLTMNDIDPFLCEVIPYAIDRAVELNLNISGGLLERINSLAAGRPFTHVQWLSLLPGNGPDVTVPLIANFLSLFPQVTHFGTILQPGQNEALPWSVLPRLRTCEIKSSHWEDLLMLSSNASLPPSLLEGITFVVCQDVLPWRPGRFNFRSRQIVFEACHPLFVSAVLGTLEREPLRRLAIDIVHAAYTPFDPYSPPMVLTVIAHYMSRFPSLTHLTLITRIQIPSDSLVTELQGLLRTPTARRNLTYLRLGLTGLVNPKPVLKIFQSGNVAPNLRVLGFTGCRYLDKTTIQAINENRNHCLGGRKKLEKLIVDATSLLLPVVLAELESSGLKVVAFAQRWNTDRVSMFEPQL